MDAKDQKLLKQHSMSIAEDRISKLPDMVLHIILSHLQMKHVVATSILSTKWRDLWKSVPCLKFGSEDGDRGCVRSMNIVERVLLFRDMSNIDKFSLRCTDQWDGSRVNAWISLIVGHKLQELFLTLHMGYSFRDSSILPPSLFLCESLTRLKLLYNGIVKVPSSISFPSLKILELEYLKFSDGYLTENFSSCPVLEELVIRNCMWDNILSKISISNPALKRLVLECSLSRYSTSKRENFDFVNINAPNLVFLSWVSRYLPIECNISDMPSLASANVVFKEIYEDRPKEELGFVANNLLGALSHVKALRIPAQVLFHAEDFLNHLPEFGNLRELEVDKESPYVSTNSLLQLPQISPYLATLVFNGDRLASELGTEWKLETMPQTMLLHLKKVVYQDFAGFPVEIAVVKFFLENAAVLEEMIIKINWELRKGERISVMEEFLKTRRVSNKCIILMR